MSFGDPIRYGADVLSDWSDDWYGHAERALDINGHIGSLGAIGGAAAYTFYPAVAAAAAYSFTTMAAFGYTYWAAGYLGSHISNALNVLGDAADGFEDWGDQFFLNTLPNVIDDAVNQIDQHVESASEQVRAHWDIAKQEVDSQTKCEFCIKTDVCMEYDEWDAATLT